MFAKQVVGVSVIVSLLIAGTASGAELKSRTWTDTTGEFKVVAAFVEVKDGKVTLKKDAGGTISVPVAKLSKEDRTWLASHARTRPSKEKPGKHVEVPEPGTHVEYQGKWLMTNVNVSQEGSEMFAVFSGTDGFLFGCNLNDLPKELENTSFRTFKGIRGTFNGIKTVKSNDVSGATPAEIEVRVIASPEPIIP